MTITASVPTLGSGTRYVLHKLHLDKESIETRMNKRGDEQDSSNYNAREDWVVFFLGVGTKCLSTLPSILYLVQWVGMD